MKFSKVFQLQCEELVNTGRNVIIMGDMNTAHHEVDVYDKATTNSGFLPEERQWMTNFFASGFVDAFRHFHKEAAHFTWWDTKTGARYENKGFRLDYTICSDSFLVSDVIDSSILSSQLGSDHCPIVLDLKEQPKIPCHPTPSLSSKLLRKKQSTIDSFLLRKAMSVTSTQHLGVKLETESTPQCLTIDNEHDHSTNSPLNDHCDTGKDLTLFSECKRSGQDFTKMILKKQKKESKENT